MEDRATSTVRYESRTTIDRPIDELDVIAADDTARTVVFVEVKTRTSDQFGGVSQAVTPVKVRRLRRLAALWLAAQRGSWAAVRIDVIGVRIGRSRAPEITHLEGVG